MCVSLPISEEKRQLHLLLTQDAVTSSLSLLLEDQDDGDATDDDDVLASLACKAKGYVKDRHFPFLL